MAFELVGRYYVAAVGAAMEQGQDIMTERNPTSLVDKIVGAIEPLIPSLTERVVVRDKLRRRLADVLAMELPAEAPAGRRPVTMLRVELQGFGSIAQTYSAAAMFELLNRYLAQMSDVVSRYQGSLDKLLGDAFEVLFGLQQDQPDQVARALACAVEIQQAMNSFNQQNESLGLPALYTGIGIHHAEVLAGTLAAAGQQARTVLGDHARLAARVEAQALRGQVLISEATYQVAKDYILAGEPASVPLRDGSALVLYELLGTTRPRPMTVPRREVRKSPRIRVRMPCYFQCVDDESDAAAAPDVVCGEVIDIGYHGLLMVSPTPLMPFDELRIALAVQMLGGQTTDLIARVVKAERDTHGYRCSLEFTALDMAGQQTIRRFVDSLMYQG
ncbi:MAG TPA: adenylate/guanylate cyclase domain-containing protein [Spongiibacteraceae bacterium]|jgi:adenylate cyclase|nr:adenylate/guanylate cyclase domain-containing protein [Spongiibacteraceae bacterium]HUH38579.1 adenylate/guanylate cyclase domain-containing protein [Spongiibacteraceae bacterium]